MGKGPEIIRVKLRSKIIRDIIRIFETKKKKKREQEA